MIHYTPPEHCHAHHGPLVKAGVYPGKLVQRLKYFHCVSRQIVNADAEQQWYPATQIARSIDDPSPGSFIGALSAFTLAALFVHHFHRRNRYQDAVLAGCVCVVASISCVLHVALPRTKWSSTMSMRTYLPPTIIVGSLLSAIMHRLGILGCANRAEQPCCVEGKEHEATKMRIGAGTKGAI